MRTLYAPMKNRATSTATPITATVAAAKDRNVESVAAPTTNSTAIATTEPSIPTTHRYKSATAIHTTAQNTPRDKLIPPFTPASGDALHVTCCTLGCLSIRDVCILLHNHPNG